MKYVTVKAFLSWKGNVLRVDPPNVMEAPVCRKPKTEDHCVWDTFMVVIDDHPTWSHVAAGLEDGRELLIRCQQHLEGRWEPCKDCDPGCCELSLWVWGPPSWRGVFTGLSPKEASLSPLVHFTIHPFLVVAPERHQMIRLESFPFHLMSFNLGSGEKEVFTSVLSFKFFLVSFKREHSPRIDSCQPSALVFWHQRLFVSF